MGLYASDMMVSLMRFAPVIELIPNAAIGSSPSDLAIGFPRFRGSCPVSFRCSFAQSGGLRLCFFLRTKGAPDPLPIQVKCHGVTDPQVSFTRVDWAHGTPVFYECE